MSLPHSIEAERALLAAMVMSPDAQTLVPEFTADDFFLPFHRQIFAVVADLEARHETVDSITVLAALEGHDAKAPGLLLDLLASETTWHNATHYAAIVQRHGLARRLVQLGTEVASRAHVQDPTDVLADARQAMADLELRLKGGPERISSRLPGVLSAIEGRTLDDGSEASVSSGLAEYDRKIAPWRPGQLVVVAGRPGMGKSAFAGGAAWRAAKRGEPALYFSLEMMWQEVAERFIGAHARVSVEAIGRGMGGATLRRLASDAYGMTDWPLWVDDRTLTMGQIAATARSWRCRNAGPKALVVIDYLGLIRPQGRSETRSLEVGRMAWGAKLLAKELACPVLLVAQLNRGSEQEERDPRLSDLRDSGEIEQHADVVIFPKRSPPLHQSGPAELQVAKNRGGRTGIIECHWHAETMTFDAVTQEVPHGWSNEQGRRFGGGDAE